MTTPNSEKLLIKARIELGNKNNNQFPVSKDNDS